MIPGNPSPQRLRADSWWITIGALLVYLLLAQDTLYKTDGHYQLAQVSNGQYLHPYHFLYGPILYLWNAMAGMAGLSIYRAATILSALGMAAGVGLSHRACALLGLNRTQCATAALVIATAPATVFFATIVELHGLFFAFAGLAFVATARLVQRPGIGRGAMLGVATGLGFLAHATGTLLVPWLAAIACVLVIESGASMRPLLPSLLAFASVHAAFVVGCPRLLETIGFALPANSASDFFLTYARKNLLHPELLPGVVWHEWVLPFFPLSVLWIPAVLRRGSRGLGIVLLVGVFLYSVFTLALLGDESERGSYTIPLAWPAALLLVRLPTRWLQLGVIVVGATAAVIQITQHDTRPSRAFADGLREVVADRPSLLIIGNHLEMEGMFVHHPNVPWRILLVEAELDAALMLQFEGLQKLDVFLQSSGRDLYLTAGARTFLLDPTYASARPSGRLILKHFETAYDLERVTASGFVADRMRTK